MRFASIAQTSADVANLAGRLQKIGRLAEVLGRLEVAEIEPAVAFLSGTTRHGRLGIGHAAIASAADAPPAEVATLSIGDVDRALGQLAVTAGKGSAAERREQLLGIFRRATTIEQDFLRRLLYGELRQGALAAVLTEAVARAARVPAESVRRAAMMQGDLATVARVALTDGERALSAAVVQLMRPVQPMLAATGEHVAQAMRELGDASIEYKLDGARVQVHKAGDEVKLFSRTLNDVTASAPEVVDLVRQLPARELILDGEVLAMDAGGTPRPFQVTMRRFGRTRNVDVLSRELPLSPFFFDCLQQDGESLIDRPLEERAAALHDVVGTLAVPRVVRPDGPAAERFVREALARGHEGVMAKSLRSTYAAGRRGAAWLKIKQARTLDLVVLAAEWGHGRRRGWLSNLHLGARDPETNGFVMLGKTFKGMTDELLRWQTERLLALAIARDEYAVHVRPELVVEIAFNEIQESPIYPGGLVLRFARVKRYRPDKSPGEADTIATVRATAFRRAPAPVRPLPK